MTNLQRFVELYKGEPNIEQLIFDYFENQNSNTFEFNGELYYIFSESDVEDRLDEDFIEEVSEFILDNEKYYPKICSIINDVIGYEHNYKTVEKDYDTLKEYYFECSDGVIYVYTQK